MRFSIFSTAVAVLFSFSASVSAQASNPFSQYPSCAQTCLLSSYSTSPCYGSTNVNCVCQDQPFLTTSTSCINSKCSLSDATTAWTTADQLCVAGKANMTAFYEGTGRNANGQITSSAATSTSTSTSPTFSNTAVPSAATPAHTKLSNGALAGIVVGVVVALTLIAAAVFWFVHNWWTIEEVGPAQNYGGEMGYQYGPKRRPEPAAGGVMQHQPGGEKGHSMWHSSGSGASA